MLATLIFGGTAIVFLAMSLATLFHLRWVGRLPSIEVLNSRRASNPPATDLPRCSVVIAARDEEMRIEGTVRHLLAQVGVDLEIIVVDDRSTDRTGDILKRLAAEDPRVRVKRVDDRQRVGWENATLAVSALMPPPENGSYLQTPIAG